MISGITSSRLNEVTNAIGELIVGENNLLSFNNNVYKYKIGDILYETDLEGNTKFYYKPPIRSRKIDNFVGEERIHTFEKETDNVLFRNPKFSVFEKFLNLELLQDNDLSAFPNNFF